MRFVLGCLFGFMAGAVYGAWQVVEANHGLFIKTISTIKGIMEVFSN